MIPEIAIAATFAFQLFLLLSLMGAIYLCRCQYLDVKEELGAILSHFNAVDNSTHDPYEPYQEERYVMCGGCGLTLPTSDGFAPVDHGCEALALEQNISPDTQNNY